MSQRVVILGAGTALPDRDRDNTFMVWESPAGSLLIDCAGRAYQQLLRANIDPKQVRGALLTHNHPDHIYGLPAFLFHLWLAHYPGTFDVYANPSTLTMARRLCEALELEQHGHMCPTNWHELPEVVDHQVLATESYTIATTPVRHSRPVLAVKIIDHNRQKTLVYSSDTEPCVELEQFAQGAHTLIHEATATDPINNYNHSTPRQAGEIAVRCGVQRLALIHYSAEHTLPEDQTLAEARAGGFTGELSITRELESYSL